MTVSDEKIEKVDINSEPIGFVQKSPNPLQMNKYLEQSSPKPTNFRSSYLNYLPESIFGYSTGLSKNFSPTTNIASASDSSSAPPGFTKRANSQDIKNYSGTSSHNFSSHQPLYARRRTETANILTDSAKSFFPFDLTSKFQVITSGFSEASRSSPNRTNTSSPCLSDLQNTEDLFAPINWNFSSSVQDDSLRKSWDSIEDDNNSVQYFQGSSYEGNVKRSESKRRQSISFSSLFDAY